MTHTHKKKAKLKNDVQMYIWSGQGNLGRFQVQSFLH